MSENRAMRRMAKFGYFSENRVFHLNTTVPGLSVGRDINDGELEVWNNTYDSLDLSLHDLVWWEAAQWTHYGRCDRDTQFRIVEITLADL